MNENIEYEFPINSQAEEKYYYTDKSAILNIKNSVIRYFSISD
jgi:hypothetical protein